jgi:hypothetical protein
MTATHEPSNRRRLRWATRTEYAAARTALDELNHLDTGGRETSAYHRANDAAHDTQQSLNLVQRWWLYTTSETPVNDTTAIRDRDIVLAIFGLLTATCGFLVFREAHQLAPAIDVTHLRRIAVLTIGVGLVALAGATYDLVNQPVVRDRGTHDGHDQ